LSSKPTIVYLFIIAIEESAMAKKNVPNAELDVLACLRQMQRATVREIRERMHP
jgi:hypothetical protein